MSKYKLNCTSSKRSFAVEVLKGDKPTHCPGCGSKECTYEESR